MINTTVNHVDKEIIKVKILPICCLYYGKVDNIEVWRGVDNRLYTIQ